MLTSLKTIIRSLIPFVELARIHRPVGILNIFFPYLYGFLYIRSVSDSVPLPPMALGRELSLLFVSAFLLRSLGCAWNDIADAQLDRQVTRTKSRPMARGAISIPMACSFTVGLLAAWIVPVSRLLPEVSTLLSYALPLIILVAAYPYAKRVTNYAQVVLGVTLGWGVLFAGAMAGFDSLASIARSITLPAQRSAEGLVATLVDPRMQGLLALYAVYVVWSVIHDTVYAFQDVRDDQKAGLKSMAVQLIGKTKPLLMLLSAIQTLLLWYVVVTVDMMPRGNPRIGETRKDWLPGSDWSMSGWSASTAWEDHWRYHLVTVLGNAIILLVMVLRVDLNDPQSCGWWFQRGSILVGTSIASGLLAEYASRAVQV